MTVSQLIERKVYVKRAVLYKLFRIPFMWRILGEKHIPRLKGSDGSMIPFGDAVSEAIDIYQTGADAETAMQLKQDMIRAWYMNTVTPEEYYIFGFNGLSQKQRDEFVSRKEKDQKMVLRVGLGDDYLLLKDKYRFYCSFRDFFHRDVCRFTDNKDDRDSFIAFCKAHSSYIAKNNK